MMLEAKNILVTGGAGFVGSALVAEVARQCEDAQIVVADTLLNGKREFLPDAGNLRVEDVDLRDENKVRELVSSFAPDVVFHLAALHFIPYCNRHPSECLDVNVVGTQNLFNALKDYPAERVMAVSSAAVYPIKETEHHEDDSVGPTDIYGLSKVANEWQLALLAGQTETRCSAARLFNVIGPNETNPHVVPEIFDQVWAGNNEIALGNVKPERDYIHAGDVARAFCAMVEKNDQSFRVFNVGTGVEHSVERLVELLAEICGRDLKIVTDTERVRKSDRMHLLCDRSRMEAECGWVPQHDLKSSLAELWQCYEKAGQGTVQYQVS